MNHAPPPSLKPYVRDNGINDLNIIYFTKRVLQQRRTRLRGREENFLSTEKRKKGIKKSFDNNYPLNIQKSLSFTSHLSPYDTIELMMYLQKLPPQQFQLVKKYDSFH
jgi:hypothetical protein